MECGLRGRAPMTAHFSDATLIRPQAYTHYLHDHTSGATNGTMAGTPPGRGQKPGHQRAPLFGAECAAQIWQNSRQSWLSRCLFGPNRNCRSGFLSAPARSSHSASYVTLAMCTPSKLLRVRFDS